MEDIDTRQEDHIYDECRYVLMENPISPPRQTVQPPVGTTRWRAAPEGKILQGINLSRHEAMTERFTGRSIMSELG